MCVFSALDDLVRLTIKSNMDSEIGFTQDLTDNGARLLLHGPWLAASGKALESTALELARNPERALNVIIDLAGVNGLDTAGAWVIDRARAQMEAAGAKVTYDGLNDAKATLLKESQFREFATSSVKSTSPLVGFLSDVGMSVVIAGRDFVAGVAFLGELIVALGGVFAHPGQFRITSLVFQLERIAFRSVPIVGLINFLVGCIVSQQSLFQLQKFGAAQFSVDLIGILVLRELSVLLTSIMIAGRSGSAITAEIGSMKMREEIDALRVMGLDPMRILIVPRVLALIISLPLLTFLGDMTALLGGLFTGLVYGNISPEIYLTRLQSAIALNTFAVGLIKAPFMALVIGLNACVEGFAVGGSAESLGQQVTNSVVKSIFMVIVVDGLFAIFFAAISY